MPGLRPLASVALTAAIFLALILYLQWRGNAYGAEFGRHPDEAAHYINGLLVRDYVSHWPPLAPVDFARTYYLHYPKVSIGHWPLGFYMLEGTWMLLFGESRTSIEILLALLAAVLGGVHYRIARERFGVPVALAATLLFLSLFHVQSTYSHLFVETACTLLMVVATLFWGRFMTTQRTRDSVLFGLVAVAAIMTKGSAMLLALVPPISTALLGRFRLWRRPAFWWPALIVVVLCGPWYWYTTAQTATGMTLRHTPLEFIRQAVPLYVETLRWSTGWLLLPVVFIGILGFFGRLRRAPESDPTLSALIALFVSTFLFHGVVPAGPESRYLLPALFVWTLFFAAGAYWLGERAWPRFRSPELRGGIVAFASLLVFWQFTFLIPPRIHYGFDDLAARLTDDPELRHEVILVSSCHNGEGMLISELAMRDPDRPSRYVVRASKLLSSSEWSGRDYTLTLSSPIEAQRAIERIGIELLVIDREPGPEMSHHRLLERMVAENPDTWHLVEHFSQPSLPGIDLYRYRGDSLVPFSPERLAAAIGPFDGNLGRSPAEGAGRP